MPRLTPLVSGLTWLFRTFSRWGLNYYRVSYKLSFSDDGRKRLNVKEIIFVIYMRIIGGIEINNWICKFLFLLLFLFETQTINFCFNEEWRSSSRCFEIFCKNRNKAASDYYQKKNNILLSWHIGVEQWLVATLSIDQFGTKYAFHTRLGSVTIVQLLFVSLRFWLSVEGGMSLSGVSWGTVLISQTRRWTLTDHRPEMECHVCRTRAFTRWSLVWHVAREWSNLRGDGPSPRDSVERCQCWSDHPVQPVVSGARQRCHGRCRDRATRKHRRKESLQQNISLVHGIK